MRLQIGILLTALAACATSGEPRGELELFKMEDPAMGTLFRASFYAADAEEAASAWEAAIARVREIERAASDWDSESELRQLSARSVGEWSQLSDDLAVLLARAQELHEVTGGAFDVSVGPYVRLWRRARRLSELPDPERLSEASRAVGMQQLELVEDRARLLAEGMRLDLGAIAKGYALDEALKVFRERGIERALLDGGGDLLAGGPPPGLSGWVIAVRPLGGEGRGWPLELAHRAIATSGDANQFALIEGQRYSHIVDPRSGWALKGSHASAVTAPDCATADALASALCVMGEDGVALLELLPEIEACYWGDGIGEYGACATGGLRWMMAVPPEHGVTSPRLR